MGYDYSVSLEGVRGAERRLNQAALKVSRMGAQCLPESRGAAGRTAAAGTADRLSLSNGAEIAGAMVEARQATITGQANLRVIAMQMELEDETLDLFG